MHGEARSVSTAELSQSAFNTGNCGENILNLGHGFFGGGIYNVKTVSWPNLGIKTVLRKYSKRPWKLDESRKKLRGARP